MVAYLKSYRDVIGHFKSDRVNAWHKLQRAQLYHFVIFMLNSGLRVGEAREMRWRDIQFDQASSDDGSEAICVVGVRKATKTSQNRDVQTQPNANKTLKEWREKTPYAGDNDLVWFGQQKANSAPKPFTNLNKSFQEFLKRVPVEGAKEGLLYNKEGEKRSLYSLRHTYATFRRDHGVGWEDLALNMGCKREQLEKHYDHSTSNTRRDSIVKVKRKGKAATAEPVSASDPFLLEAMQMFQAGKLDDATLLNLLKARKTMS